MVELADARDSKSRVRKDVRVQVPPPAPFNNEQSLLLGYRRGGCFRSTVLLDRHQVNAAHRHEACRRRPQIVEVEVINPCPLARPLTGIPVRVLILP